MVVNRYTVLSKDKNEKIGYFYIGGSLVNISKSSIFCEYRRKHNIPKDFIYRDSYAGDDKLLSGAAYICDEGVMIPDLDRLVTEKLVMQKAE